MLNFVLDKYLKQTYR